MAANYSQYTDHNEVGGLNVGLEDAKLAAADSVDEVVSTDCVLMKDASGNPVKILKEDFNEAVRDALGSILSGNVLGTAIGKVAALGSSDNDFGSISTGDLASVLGGTGIVCGVESVSVASGKVLQIDSSPTGNYAQVICLQGQSTASFAWLICSGYGVGISRNNRKILFEASQPNFNIYGSTYDSNALYIKNNHTAACRVSILLLKGTVTVTELNALPASGITEITI